VHDAGVDAHADADADPDGARAAYIDADTDPDGARAADFDADTYAAGLKRRASKRIGSRRRSTGQGRLRRCDQVAADACPSIRV
jgi:hypothetical protein